MPRLFTALLVAITVLSFAVFGWIEYHERQQFAAWVRSKGEKGEIDRELGGGIANDLLRGLQPPDIAAFDERVIQSEHARRMEVIREWMQPTLSLVLVGSSLFVILNSRFGPKDKHWAYGIIGTIVGFWMRS